MTPVQVVSVKVSEKNKIILGISTKVRNLNDLNIEIEGSEGKVEF